MENEGNRGAMLPQEEGDGRSGWGRESPEVLGWLPRPSRCCTWTTLRMGKGNEEISFMDGFHLSGTGDGEFRWWSKATLGSCCYGNSYLTDRLKLYKLITALCMMSKRGHHIVKRLTSPLWTQTSLCKMKYLITYSLSSFLRLRASISMIPGSNVREQLI